MTFVALQKKITSKDFSPVYLLHGEEPYFIDRLVALLETHVLEAHEKDFNQEIVYGKETEALSLLSSAKQYPMMSERRLVLVKEAQDFKSWDTLEPYINEPLESTILVFAYKYKNMDARTKFFKAVQKHEVFKSEKIKEYQLPEWIGSYLKSKGFSFASRVPHLLSESIGNDLSRISNEIEKLAIVLREGEEVNEAHIEKHIGISKEYNVFELNNAVAAKDLAKAIRIVQYFESNPKAADLVQVISMLFRYFSQIMRIHFMQNKSREHIASTLKIHPYVVGELLQSKNNFTPKKIAENIEVLHAFDLKSKGVGNAGESSGALMRELVIQLIL
ncbi:MAG: DNA polymerase III subunit delta [Flavobacteriales bacterium]